MNLNDNNLIKMASKDLTLFDLQKFFKYLIILFIIVSAFGFLVIFVSQLESANYYLNAAITNYVRLFDLNKEANIPTWYSSLILFLSSCLLFFISYYKGNKDSNQKYWKVLAIIFLYLSVDESSSIHETLNNPVRSLLHLSGIFYWSWIVPAAFVLVILFFYFFRFLLSLPKHTRNLFLLSATIFVIGAMGLEMIGGLLYSNQMDNSLASKTENFFEEVMEMAGVLIFIYSLLKYIKKDSVSVLVRRTSE